MRSVICAILACAAIAACIPGLTAANEATLTGYESDLATCREQGMSAYSACITDAGDAGDSACKAQAQTVYTACAGDAGAEGGE